jgi:hypothetical protein
MHITIPLVLQANHHGLFQSTIPLHLINYATEIGQYNKICNSQLVMKQLLVSVFWVLLCSCSTFSQPDYDDRVLHKLYQELYTLEDAYDSRNLAQDSNWPTYIQSLAEIGARVDLELQRVLAGGSKMELDRIMENLVKSHGVTSYFCLPYGRKVYPHVSVYARNPVWYQTLATCTEDPKYSKLARVANSLPSLHKRSIEAR